MNYKEHTQQRYLERFNCELSDEEYLELCKICNSDAVLFKFNSKDRNKKRKIIVFYKNKYIWCALSKRKLIKTVFPVKTRQLRKFNINMKNAQ